MVLGSVLVSVFVCTVALGPPLQSCTLQEIKNNNKTRYLMLLLIGAPDKI